MILRTTILSLTLAAASLWAQPGRGPTIHSPEVSADGKVTFRVRAPNAKEVAVTGIGQRLVMQKDEQGVWSATTETLQPDLYTYAFSVDGATFNDPLNALFKSSYGNAGQSMVRVPGPAVWNPGEGPHGVVDHGADFQQQVAARQQPRGIESPARHLGVTRDPVPRVQQ